MYWNVCYACIWVCLCLCVYVSLFVFVCLYASLFVFVWYVCIWVCLCLCVLCAFILIGPEEGLFPVRKRPLNVIRISCRLEKNRKAKILTWIEFFSIFNSLLFPYNFSIITFIFYFLIIIFIIFVGLFLLVMDFSLGLRFPIGWICTLSIPNIIESGGTKNSHLLLNLLSTAFICCRNCWMIVEFLVYDCYNIKEKE